MPPTDDRPSLRYWAFISYSHRDKRWAEWLHRGLETYRLPKRLWGRPGRGAPVPRRVHPVFRDREELPTSADLGTAIRDALHASRCLIVVCSPRAAASRWVDEEIRTFKRAASDAEDRTLCLVVDGEPNAADKPGQKALECFPAAVRRRVRPDGDLEGTVEPIAADVRPGGDGKRNALLKVVAGVIGIGFDDLRQRDQQRRQRRMLAVTVSSLALLVVVVGLAVAAVVARGEAEAKHREAEEQRSLAVARGEQAREEAERNRKRLYLNRVALADVELERGHTVRARAILSACPHDLRGWEWGRLWTSTDESVEAWTLHRWGLYAVAVSPDGRSAAVAGANQSVFVLRLGGAEVPQALAGHETDVAAVAWHPGGSRLAAGALDGKVRIFDVARPSAHTLIETGPAVLEAVEFDAAGRVLGTIGANGVLQHWDVEDGHKLGTVALADHAHCATFAPALGAAAVGGIDGRIVVWTADGLEQPMVIRGHAAGVAAVVLDAAATRVASADRTGQVRIWRTGTGELETTLPLESAPMMSLAFSPDGKVLATGGGGGEITLWEVPSGRRVGRRRGHAAMVRGLSYRPDGGHFVSASNDGTVRFWDAKEVPGTRVLREAEEEAFLDVAWDAEGRRVVAAGKSGALSIWGLAGGMDVRIPGAHGGPVESAAFLPDGRRILSSGWGTVRVGSAGGRDPPRTLGSDAEGTVVACSADGRWIASGGLDGLVRVWDEATGALVRQLKVGGSNTVRSLCFDPKGTRLAVGTNAGAYTEGDGPLVVWDTATWQRTTKPTGHVGAALSLGWDRLGRRLISADPGPSSAQMDAKGRPSAVLVHDASTGEPAAVLRSPGTVFEAATFGAEDRRILCVHDDGSIGLWDAEAAAEILRWPAAASAARFSPDGLRVAAACRDGVVRIWDNPPRDQAMFLEGHVGGVGSVASDREGRVLFSAGGDGTVRAWDAASGREIYAQRDQPGAARVAMSPAGRFLATGGRDGSVRLRDATTGRTVRTLLERAEGAPALAFDRTGRRLASGGWDGTVRVWDVESEAPPKTLTGIPHVFALAFHPDGTRLLGAGGSIGPIAPYVSGWTSEVRIWDVTTGNVALTVPELNPETDSMEVSPAAGKVDAAAWTTDGRFLVGGEKGWVTLRDGNTGAVLSTLARGHGAIRSLALDAEARILLTTTGDVEVRLWDLATGARLGTLADHRGPVTVATFAGHPTRVVTASNDGTVGVWRLLPRMGTPRR